MTYPNLKAEMARNCISRDSIAKTAGVSVQTVSNWMNGYSKPSVEHAKAIRRELLPNHSIDYLFE